MKSTTVARLGLNIARNPFFSALLTLLVLLAALAMQSPVLILLSGIMAFGRPLLYSALIDATLVATSPERNERRSSFDRRGANRSIALGTR